MDPFVVLIIDDDHSLLAALELVIGRIGGVRVIAVDNGDSAVRAAAEHRPRLILADVELGDLDGYAVCRLIRAEAADPEAQIWFITGEPSRADPRQAGQVAAQGFLMKPFGAAEVRKLVRGAMAAAAGPAPV